MDRGAWQTTAHGASESWTRLCNYRFNSPSSVVPFSPKTSPPGVAMICTPGLYTGYAQGQGEARETKVPWGVDWADQLKLLRPEPSALLKGGAASLEGQD